MALVQALGSVSKEYAKSTASSIKQAFVPSGGLTGAMYSMSTLGPVFKSIADEFKAIKERDNKSDKTQEAANKQSGEMISLLKEIKKIQLQQLALMSGGGAKQATAALEASYEAGQPTAAGGGGKEAGGKSASDRESLGFKTAALVGAIGLAVAAFNDMLPSIKTVSKGLAAVYNNLDVFKQAVAGLATAAAGVQLYRSQKGLGTTPAGRGPVTVPESAAPGRVPPVVVPGQQRTGQIEGVPGAGQRYAQGAGGQLILDSSGNPIAVPDSNKPAPKAEPKKGPSVGDRLGAAKNFKGKGGFLSGVGKFVGKTAMAGLGFVGAGMSAIQGDYTGAALQATGTGLMMFGGPLGMAAGAGMLIYDAFFRNKDGNAATEGKTETKPSVAVTGVDTATLDKAMDYIKKKENPNPKLDKNGKFRAHDDGAGNATIGYGHLITSEERKNKVIRIGSEMVPYENGITKDQAEALLKQDTNEAMNKAVKKFGGMWKNLTDSQKVALTSYAYNTGNIPGNLVDAIRMGREDLVRHILGKGTTGRNVMTGDRKTLAGLVTRRKEEADAILGKTDIATGLGSSGQSSQAPSAVAQNTEASSKPLEVMAGVAKFSGEFSKILMTTAMSQKDRNIFDMGGNVNNNVVVQGSGQGPVAIPSAKGGTSYGNSRS